MITNTSKLPPAVHLAEALVKGSSRAIEDSERRGQEELVASTLLPTKLHPGRAEFEALGFKLGAVVEDDPIFQHVELPAGWTRAGTDHAMHSHILDAKGRERASVFYKAAFYDRHAHASLTPRFVTGYPESDDDPKRYVVDNATGARVATFEGHMTNGFHDNATPAWEWIRARSKGVVEDWAEADAAVGSDG